ncbi:outer-membrane lipoprotein carrier protein LolA [Gammaproteobacteria bacterium]|nr:outer-membrane lipoprotein carrier protein LolA [Gammaproteobacteria bacterium]
MSLRNYLPFYFLLLISKPISSDELVTEDTFINYLTNLNSFSASFSQKTYTNQMERVVEGQIRANRKGMFKLTYSEPINEVLLSDGISFHRYDPELEQLEIRPIENLINETPIGLFSAQSDKFFELYNLNSCISKKNKLYCVLESQSKESYLKTIELSLLNNTITLLSYKDSFDQEVLLQFSDVSLQEIDSKEFHLNIPEGIDIVKH